MTSVPTIEQRERHPAAFRTTLLVALLGRFADGALRGALVAYGGQSGLTATIITWIVIVSMVPIGWLCDRWWGERRVATAGAWMMAASVLLGALGSFSLTVTGSLVLAALAAVFLRISLPMLLGGAYDRDDPRRMTVFMWLEAASSLGIFASSLLAKLRADDLGLWAFALPAVSAAASLWALQRLRIDAVATSKTGESPAGSTRATRIVVSILAISVLTAVAYLVSDAMNIRDMSRYALPATALVVAVGFFTWAHRQFPAPAQRAAIRTLAIVMAAAVVFWVFNSETLSWISMRVEPFTNLNLTSMFRVAAAPVLILIWRRFTRMVVPATAAAFGLSFALLGCASIAAAAIGREPIESYRGDEGYWPLLVYALASAGNLLLSAAALNTVTTLSPQQTAGRMIAVWYLPPTIASLAFLIDQTLEPRLLVPVMVAATLFLALLFLPGRETGVDPVRPRLVIARPGRLRKTMLALSGTIAVGSAVSLLIGQGEIASARQIATAPPPTFRGADGAFLPDDPDLGFAMIERSVVIVGTDTAANAYAQRDEGPAQPVRIRPFAIGKFEVTVAQYRQCVTEYGCQPADARATTGGDDLPVRHVSSVEALQYCAWLEKKLAGMQTGRIGPLLANGARVTLPSEAEWEGASLADGGGTYPWSGPLEPSRANYAESGRLGPVRVGEFASGASLAGVQDLIGNLAEWTRSEYRSYPYNPDDGREDTSNLSAARVIRGGSFYDGPSLVRITARRAADPGRGYDFVGFRVAIARVAASASTTSGAAPPASAPPSQRAPAAAK